MACGLGPKLGSARRISGFWIRQVTQRKQYSTNELPLECEFNITRASFGLLWLLKEAQGGAPSFQARQEQRNQVAVVGLLIIDVAVQLHIDLPLVESKTRTPNERSLDLPGNRMNSPSDLQAAKINRPGRLCGGTKVANHWKTGPRVMVSSLSPVWHQRLGCSVVAVVG